MWENRQCHRDSLVAAGGSSLEFWTDERCFITELLNCEASPEASLAVARVEPGVTTQLHRMAGTIERYIVRKGEGVVEIDGVSQRLQSATRP